MTMSRRLVAEGLGTALLLMVVVGSGVMAERLCGGNIGLALLANAVATGAGLYALILTFGPISGAHFNPLVTMMAWHGEALSGPEALVRMASQVGGAVIGVWLVHACFDLPVWQLSAHGRTGAGQWLSEVVASAGLLSVIASTSRHAPERTPAAVASWVVAAYWFTASTAFANPAVTLARALTDSFAGIRPDDVPGFLAAQLIGAVLALIFIRWLLDRPLSD